jgi:hypothetical protein
MRLSSEPFGRDSDTHDHDEELADLLLTLHDVWNAVGSLSLQQQTILLLRFAEEVSRAKIAAMFRPKARVDRPQLFSVSNKLEESVKEQPCS